MPASDKKEQNGLPSCYCHRGDEVKSAIVRDYIIQPVAHLKLIPGQVKASYSNYPLTDQYYCFSFQGRIDKEDIGAFFCGKDVAKDFIQLINGTELPLFNPLKSESTTNGSSSGSSSGCFSTGIKPNADKKLFIDAARLLMMLWDSTSKGQTPLAYVLNEAITDGCSAQLNQDTFLKEFCSYSIGDRSPLAV
ncbi:hypothetical protein M2263_002966 [Providencia alcalifaciens]|nr:hypothetical protein [Providencia alcalifaciens]